MKTIVCLLALISLSAFSQNKDKVSTGHENVLTSQVLKVGTCTTDAADMLHQVARAVAGETTIIFAEYKVNVKYKQTVELFDVRKVKKDGSKTKEKINVKEIEREVVKTKKSYRSVSVNDLDGYPKDAVLLAAQGAAAVLAAESDCKATAAKLRGEISL